MPTLTGWAARPNWDGGRPPSPDRLRLRDVGGDVLPLDPARWHGPITAAEQQLLVRLTGPVLDVGCGPGRIVEGLASRGVVTLGVDPAPGAVSLARRRGCAVLQRSVFETLPGEGRWRTALLLDGNIGIGGDPVRLLRRCGALVHLSGCVVVEVEAPGSWLADLPGPPRARTRVQPVVRVVGGRRRCHRPPRRRNRTAGGCH